MLIKMQVGEQDRGELQVNVTDSDNAPIRDARVTISEPDQPLIPTVPLKGLKQMFPGRLRLWI